tara:strand:- start:65 stop:538 length:474 start_codon:yes stop_codon:yes gene_type:complete
MNKAELREKIRAIIPTVYKAQIKSDTAAVEFDELTKFPELKAVIVDLLTSDFDSFLASIDWVAPKPTTFRINLKNGEEFYLTYSKRSFIAQVEGKKYYLLNLPEEQRAVQAIARILRYGAKTEEGGGADVDSAEDLSVDAGGGDVDVEVEDTESTEV